MNPVARAKKIFLQAVELSDGAQRAAYAARACDGDPQLRAAVDRLLGAWSGGQGFLERPALLGAPTREVPPRAATAEVSETVGSLIGPYKLLEQIGEGGMGVVYMAEQERPVRRRVALKVIKLGMDTRQVVARFEAERQALAMMDHPNIARVLDAGATETGRPYFVMELVRGSPITEYCDKHKVGPRERLALFIDVCHAVQHAHHKGVIHRDLKPSNILVTLGDDGKPSPKVIDFGIAKAIHHRLTDKTLFTEHRQLIGTPQYMSPEQAEADAVDVDTRTDVYSLGVLLYELLTGTTPIEGRQLAKMAIERVQEVIREWEPPRPSTRLSTLGKDHPEAIRCRTNFAGTQLRAGDLEAAERLCKESLSLAEAKLVPDHEFTFEARVLLEKVFLAQERFPEAEALGRKVLEQSDRLFPGNLEYRVHLAGLLGSALLGQEKWSEAEPLLRESVEGGRELEPDAWPTFRAMSQLGEALLGLGKLKEAAPLIVEGYRGLKSAQEDRDSWAYLRSLRRATERLAELAEARGKPAEAARFRAEAAKMERQAGS